MHSLSRVQSCISDITNWMTSSKLIMLNRNKPQLLVINVIVLVLQQLAVTCKSASHAAKNVGVWFDEFLSMGKQIWQKIVVAEVDRKRILRELQTCLYLISACWEASLRPCPEHSLPIWRYSDSYQKQTTS